MPKKVHAVVEGVLEEADGFKPSQTLQQGHTTTPLNGNHGMPNTHTHTRQLTIGMEAVLSKNPQNMTWGKINMGPSAMETLMFGDTAATKNPIEMAQLAHRMMNPRMAK
jgi:hypothetical protein